MQLRIGIHLIDILEVENMTEESQINIDHFCLQINPFDYEGLKGYFESEGVAIYGYGKRYGAQGLGHSFYLQDPQGNEVELKEYAKVTDHPMAST